MKTVKYLKHTDNAVVFHRRPDVIISCPHCWTEQRSTRNFCYQCGITFVFETEQDERKAV